MEPSNSTRGVVEVRTAESYQRFVVSMHQCQKNPKETSHVLADAKL
jgi:hypothetical protein